MRVMCIESSDHRFSTILNKFIDPLNLQVGSVYTVVDEDVYDGYVVYELAEFPPDPNRNWFFSRLFAQIPDGEEDELIEDRGLVEVD